MIADGDRGTADRRKALLGRLVLDDLDGTHHADAHRLSDQRMVGEPKFWEAISNNLLWLTVVPAVSTAFGLLAAQLTDRISWGNIAKSLIFMPMAISFVGASVIWKFVYDYRDAGSEQIGILNAIVQGMGMEPQAWVTVPFWNNFFLMAILIWIQTGFAMVILSAALRGVPEDTIEAAIIDGAVSLGGQIIVGSGGSALLSPRGSIVLSPVPEPETLAMWLAGLALLGACRRAPATHASRSTSA